MAYYFDISLKSQIIAKEFYLIVVKTLGDDAKELSYPLGKVAHDYVGQWYRILLLNSCNDFLFYYNLPVRKCPIFKSQSFKYFSLLN